MEKIQFGTDGWRAVIGDGFTYANLGRVTQATCHQIKKKNKHPLVMIGYDHRFLSEEFAITAAKIAVANGCKVELASRPITSPALSFHVKHRKASVGIMITASHNPAHFSGFKLKGPHGGSVNEEWTREVEDLLDAEPVKSGEEVGKRVDFVPGYVKWIKNHLKDFSTGKLKGTVVFDAMYGPGGQVLLELLGGQSKIEVIRAQRDPLFGGINPEPIESQLGALKEAVKGKKALVGIALDGDGDRVGLVDNNGHYVPPHTVMPLILEHLIENRKMKGKVVQTVSMGYLPERIASKYNLAFEETSVGFKHIAARIRKEKVLFGGEESGGFGVGLWSPERDGILCGLLVLEFMMKTRATLSDLIKKLHENFGMSYFKRVDFHLNSPVNKEEWTQRIVSHLNSKIANSSVKKVNSFDGVKVVTEDDSWVLMRPSGTEPLIRTYSEAKSTKIVHELLQEAHRLVHLPPPKAPRGSRTNGKKEKKVKRK